MSLNALQVSKTPTAEAPRVHVIGIGVQKAATSWLYRCLTEHPELRGSIAERADKELNFFNHRYEYGYDWYEAHFDPGPRTNLEFSVLYFHDRNVPERIHRYNPDLRLLLCLRNPVDRAISQYRHEIRHRRQVFRPGGFWDAVERNPSYIEQGRYAEHMERWLNYFERSQFHIVQYDDIKERPTEVLRETFRVLGVDESFGPETAMQRVNTSRVLGGGPVRDALGIMKKGVRLVAGKSLTRRLGSTALGSRIQDYRYVEIGGEEELRIGNEDRRRLADVFAPELERLGRLLGRSYSYWYARHVP